MPKPRTASTSDVRDLTGVLPPVMDIVPVEVDVDDDWRVRVKNRMRKLRTSDGAPLRQKDLAAWIGMGQPNLSELISMDVAPEKRPRRSAYCQRLSKALGVKMPRAAEIQLLASELVELSDDEGLDALVMELRTRAEFERSRKPR